MQNVKEIKTILSKLNRSEKVELLQWVANDLNETHPGIESNPEICGGEPCIIRTRIPVWLIEKARLLGASEADILKYYPTLRAQDLVNAWMYVHSHQEEINNQIRENEEA